MERTGSTSRVSTMHCLSLARDLMSWNSKRPTSSRDARGPISRLTTPVFSRDCSPSPGDQLPSVSAPIPPRPPTPGPSKYAHVSERPSPPAPRSSKSKSIDPRRGMSPVTFYFCTPQTYQHLPGRLVFRSDVNSVQITPPLALERACSSLSKLLDPQCETGIPFREFAESLWRCSRCDGVMLEPFASRHVCPPSGSWINI